VAPGSGIDELTFHSSSKQQEAPGMYGVAAPVVSEVSVLANDLLRTPGPQGNPMRRLGIARHGARVDEEKENKSTRVWNMVQRVGCDRISLLRHILRSGCELQVSIRTPRHPSNVSQPNTSESDP
jgi:hypothetical protein